MKRILLFAAIIACLFSCDNSDPTPALSSDDQSVIDDLDQLVVQINGPEFDLPSSDLAFLDDLADARIVGLGEATHGSKEFSQMKHRIFKYMVEKHQFRGIVFEIDVAEAMIFEDYIQGRRDDDLVTLMKENMYFWVWTTNEVKDMLFWMRSYNASHAEADKVHIFGMDCQVQKYNSVKLVSLIAKVDAQTAADVDSHLQLYKALQVAGDTTNSKIIAEQIKYVAQVIADHRDDLIEAGLTGSDYNDAVHLSRAIAQTQQVLYDGKFYDYSLRDKFMAENARWVLDHMNGGQTSKICLWAHNDHVANTEGYESLGHLLKRDLPGQYKSLGFAFSKGGFNAVNDMQLKANSISTDPLANSLNYFFSHSSRKMFSLNLSRIDGRHPALLNVVSTNHLFLSIGSGYNDKPEDYYSLVVLNTFFDVVVYFDKVVPAQFVY